jgi:putative endonuclease
MSEKYYVYVLLSEKHGGLYKGRTANLEGRLQQHNKGKVTYTKSGIPWKIIYFEEVASLEAAIQREKYFKTAAGRRYLKQKISSE